MVAGKDIVSKDKRAEDAVKNIYVDDSCTCETHLGSQPFFSIVLPVYGVDIYLPDALEDLLEQSFTDWEAIIVDDCSPDRSRAIAETFVAKDSRFKIVSHEVNRGLSAARNTGLQAAHGEYVWFPDPDDRYEHDLLQQVADSLKRQKSPVVVIGHSEEYFFSTGENIRSVDFALENTELNQKELRALVMQLEKKTQYGYAWNKLYERNYLINGGYRFVEGLPLIEDIEFNVRVFQDLSQLNLLGKPFYHYAKREKANLTNKFVPQYYEVHRQRIQLLRDQQDSWGLLNEEVKSTLGMLFARYILSALERNCEPQSGMTHKQQIQWCKEVFADPLFEELIPYAKADSAVLSVCLKPLKARNAAQCVLLGKLIHAAKYGFLHNAFLKLKGGR